MPQLRGLFVAALIAFVAATGIKTLNAMNQVVGQDITKVKQTLGFASWPGKAGPLKPGLKFVPSTVPALNGFAVRHDDVRQVKAGNSTSALRSLELANGTQTLRLEIQVCIQDTDDAQETLVAGLAASQKSVDLHRRGDQNGIAVGDLNFVNDIVPGNVVYIHFVRNNIRIRVTKSGGNPVDVIAVATAIDGQITQQPNFTRKTLKTQLPVISSFIPQSAVVPPLASTPVSLNATDPQSGNLTYHLEGNLGQIKRDDSVSPPTITFTADDELGKAHLSVLVTNENLLFDSAKTLITISQ